jgi:oxygen-dependent protoporphyrinogen oxidase
MGLDLVLPRGRHDHDESLADFVRRRLGREALERVADPLVSGIYTGDPERLSVAATMPRFRELEAAHRSIILGLRRSAQASRDVAGARYGLFMSHRDGMSALVDAHDPPADSAVSSARASSGLRTRAAGAQVGKAGARPRRRRRRARVSAFTSADLLAANDAALADTLRAIPYASSAIVTLRIRTRLPRGLPGFGFVVPAAERRDSRALVAEVERRAPGHKLVRSFVGVRGPSWSSATTRRSSPPSAPS